MKFCTKTQDLLKAYNKATNTIIKEGRINKLPTINNYD